MNSLKKFLEDHEDDKPVWFILTNGFIRGILHALEGETPTYATLSAVEITLNGKSKKFDSLTIAIEHIIGWGSSSN